MVDFEQRARVQIASDILPPARDTDANFVISLADAIRFVMSKQEHEQERLEILIAGSEGMPGDVLKADRIRELHADAEFPRPLPYG
jgi:hypothetical protein